MNTKILVCCHKDDIMATASPYMPIHVGKDLSTIELGIQGDNAGNNISNKNKSYCELTGLYWAWKNLKDTDIIGLCHYRRYFDFYNKCGRFNPFVKIPSKDFNSTNLTIPDNILNKVMSGKVVVPRKSNLGMDIRSHYCCFHYSEDFRVVESYINKNKTQLEKDIFYKVMYCTHKIIYYNMFIMRWQDFCEYCEWLFDILEYAEQEIDISNRTPVQQRVFGYLAERLFNVWLRLRNKDLIQKPVIMFTEGKVYKPNPMKTIWLNLKNDISFKILSPIAHEF